MPKAITPTVLPAKKAYGFQPGKSGNPGGRPKSQMEGLKEFREKCRWFMEQHQGWHFLVNMAMDGTDPKNRRFALQLIIEYAYGKPTQPVEFDPQGGPLVIEIIDATLANTALPAPSRAAPDSDGS